MNKISGILLKIFAVFWIMFIAVQYFSNYSAKFSNILNFSHYEYVLVAVGLNATILKLVNIKFSKKENNIISINILLILICIIFNVWLAFIINGFKIELISFANLLPASFSLFKNLGYTLVSTIIVIFSAYSAGDIVIRKLLKIKSLLKNYLYASAVGVVYIVYALFIAGSVGELNAWVGRAILALPLIINYKASIWLTKALVCPIAANPRMSKTEITLLSLGIMLIGYILLNLLKPFPIGWDGANLYINISNLITQNHALISGFEAYNWSIFTSIGLVVFQHMPISLLLSFIGGIWALLTVYILAKKKLTQIQAWILGLTIFTLPSIQFLSFVDPKVDLGFLFFGLISFLMIIDFIRTQNIRYLAIAGLIIGFTFAIKYTAVFLIIGLLGLIFSFSLGWSASLIPLGIALAFLFGFSILEVRALGFSSLLNYVLAFSGILLSIISTVIIFLKKTWVTNVKPVFINSIIFVLFTLIGFAPWLLFNYSTTGIISIDSLLYGKRQNPVLDASGVNLALTDFNKIVDVEPDVKSTQNTGIKEELGRYAGYENEALRFFSIFYDINVGTNIKGPIVDIGFLILALFPLSSLMLMKEKYPKFSLIYTLSLLSFLCISYMLAKGSAICATDNFYSCVSEKLFENFNFWEIAGFSFVSYLFLPLLYLIQVAANNFNAFIAPCMAFLISALIVVPSFFLHSKIYIKATVCFCFITLILWIIMGFGVYWYSMLTFVLFIMLIFWNFHSYKKLYGTNFEYKLTSMIIVFWLIVAVFGVFQVKSGRALLETAFTNYILTDTSQLETLGDLNYAYREGVEAINSRPLTKIYKVGSFLNLFITDNHKRVINDNQLDIFNNITLTQANKVEVAQALKQQGIEYIIYDLNTASIDSTSEKTLTQKAEKFESFLKDNSQLELITTDRRFIDPDGGYELEYEGKNIKYARKVFGDTDKMFSAGSVAVYQIK